MEVELVSIITPCYNSSKYIRETFESIKNQTYSNWEWIIVDDCSTDDSVKLIKSFDETRIKLNLNKKNCGPAISRNKALDISNGRYITFIDSDDIWLPEFLSKTISFLQSTNETLVYTNYKRVDENLNPLLKDFIAEDYIDKERILYNCPIPMLTSVYDSQKIGKIKFPEVKLREDHAMWINLLNKITYARSINESLGIYRMRENSISRNKIKIAKSQFLLYKNFLKMNLIKSSFYTMCWAFNGLKKYGKF